MCPGHQRRVRPGAVAQRGAALTLATAAARVAVRRRRTLRQRRSLRLVYELDRRTTHDIAPTRSLLPFHHLISGFRHTRTHAHTIVGRR